MQTLNFHGSGVLFSLDTLTGHGRPSVHPRYAALLKISDLQPADRECFRTQLKLPGQNEGLLLSHLVQLALTVNFSSRDGLRAYYMGTSYC